jgi:uncharacterized protein YdaL
MADKKNNGGQMRNTQIYLLKLNSPSDNVLRLWTGKSLHTLRHCSAKQMGSVLVKMQQNVDALQKSMGILQNLKEEFASVSTARVKETMEQDNGLSKAGARLG